MNREGPRGDREEVPGSRNCVCKGPGAAGLKGEEAGVARTRERGRKLGPKARPGRGVSRWSGSQNTEGGADGQTVLRVPAPSGHGGSGERAGVVGQ